MRYSKFLGNPTRHQHLQIWNMKMRYTTWFFYATIGMQKISSICSLLTIFSNRVLILKSYSKPKVPVKECDKLLCILHQNQFFFFFWFQNQLRRANTYYHSGLKWKKIVEQAFSLYLMKFILHFAPRARSHHVFHQLKKTH